MCGPGPDALKPTGDQIAQAKINAEMWEYYHQNYRPLVLKYSHDATETGDIRKKQVAGQVNADVMKNAGAVSPTNALTNQKRILDIAEVNADAQSSGKAATKMRQLGETQNVINIGKGQTTRAMAGLDEIASMSVDSAMRSKERDMRTQASMENAVGSTIGAIAGTGAALAMGGSSNKSRTPEGALIYDSPEYKDLAKKWGI